MAPPTLLQVIPASASLTTIQVYHVQEQKSRLFLIIFSGGFLWVSRARMDTRQQSRNRLETTADLMVLATRHI